MQNILKNFSLPLLGRHMQSRYRRIVAGTYLVLMLSSMGDGPLAAEPNLPPVTNGLPQVLRVSGDLQLGGRVVVYLSGLRDWELAGHSAQKLLLFLQGRPCGGDFPEAVDVEGGSIEYHLAITPENREVWTDLLRRPSLSRRIKVSVGPEGTAPFPTLIVGANSAWLTIIPPRAGLLSTLVVGITLGTLLMLAKNTDLIRDSGFSKTPARMKPFSLARTQMAFWFYLIFAGYVVLWLITGDLNTVTDTLLGLMGISAGTAVGGALIDHQKRASVLERLAAATRTDLSSTAGTGGSAGAQAPPISATLPVEPQLVIQLEEQLDTGFSRGFLRDILSGRGGISLNRFQIFAWTLALGMIFISSIYTTLRMPDFSPTLLGLMGISAGTYLGFKTPDK
jgi:hypothetical protein